MLKAGRDTPSAASSPSGPFGLSLLGLFILHRGEDPLPPSQECPWRAVKDVSHLLPGSSLLPLPSSPPEPSTFDLTFPRSLKPSWTPSCVTCQQP